jgi:hypothetical protein
LNNFFVGIQKCKNVKKKKIKELSNISHFLVSYSDFTNIIELSILGAYRTVLSDFCPFKNKKVAIKVISQEFTLEKYEKYHTREVKNLASLDDFFLIYFVDFSLEKPLVIVPN